MPRYHINQKTGRIGICRASGVRRCPVGGEHYSDFKSAQSAYEKKMEEENNIFEKLTVRKNSSQNAIEDEEMSKELQKSLWEEKDTVIPREYYAKAYLQENGDYNVCLLDEDQNFVGRRNSLINSSDALRNLEKIYFNSRMNGHTFNFDTETADKMYSVWKNNNGNDDSLSTISRAFSGIQEFSDKPLSYSELQKIVSAENKKEFSYKSRVQAKKIMNILDSDPVARQVFETF